MGRDYCYQHGNGVYEAQACPECATVRSADRMDDMVENQQKILDLLLRRGDSLDAAWAEAEAALPDDDETGWRKFAHLTLERTADGCYRADVEVPGDVGLIARVIEDTPAAALRALAARLREAQP